MVNKLFVFHGDLGAGKNILKNIVLLSDQVHFPVATNENRAQWLITNIYKPESKFDWFVYEYALKDYQRFGINMVAGDADVDQLLNIPLPLKHLLEDRNYALDLFNKYRTHEIAELDYVKFLMVYPETEFGIRWQVRAYAEKKKPDQMHNFTYINQDLIAKHQEQYGVDSWIKVNLYNFYQDVQDYVKTLKLKSWPFVPMEWLLDQSKWSELVETLENNFSVTINHTEAYRLLQAWTELHWPVNSTDTWEHIDIFDNFRSTESDLVIRTHSCSQ